MIPFRLFKYIYFRNFLYTLIYMTLLGIIVIIQSNSITYDIIDSNYIYLLIIPILFICFLILCILKLVLKQVIFNKYNKIQINTNIKEVNWNLLFKINLIRAFIIIIVRGIYNFVCSVLFVDYNDTLHDGTLDIFAIIPVLIIDYFICNWLLGEYITVSHIENNNIENSIEDKDSKNTE